MADTRKDTRAPAALRVKYKSATVDQFIVQSGQDISAGGIFVKTKKPLKIGALLKFEFQLSDASPVMTGVGRVAWRRPADAADASHPPGMGLKFLKLEGDTEALVQRIEAERVSGESRYEDAAGAEVGEGAFSPAVAEPAPPPAPPAPPAPAPGGSGARPAPGSGSGPRPASMPAGPAPVAPGGVAGLFGSSKAPPAPAATAPSGGSFFGAPKGGGDQVRDASEFLASAFSGASEDTAAAARQQADEAQRASERPAPMSEPAGAMLPDDLWDDDEDASPQPEAPRDSGPPSSSDAPDATATADAGDPFADSIPVSMSSAPPAEARVSEPDPFGALADDTGGDFGEVDLANSIPPAADGAPVTTLSGPPPGPESESGADSVPPVAAAAAAPAEKKSSGGLIAALVLLVIAGGGGGYYMMTQGGQQGGSPAPTPTAPNTDAPPPTAPATDEGEAGGEGAEGAEEPVAGTGKRVALQVTSRPRTAEVLVRGELRGESPLKLMLPEGQPVFIMVRAEGFTPLRRKVTPGKSPTTHFELKELQYEVVVASEPTGAEVSAEGNTVTTPGILKLGHLEGVVSISAQKEGFRRTSRPVRIDEFKLDGEVMRASLSISLSPLPEGAVAEPAAAPARPAKKKRRRARKKAAAEAASEEPKALPDNPF